MEDINAVEYEDRMKRFMENYKLEIGEIFVLRTNDGTYINKFKFDHRRRLFQGSNLDISNNGFAFWDMAVDTDKKYVICHKVDFINPDYTLKFTAFEGDTITLKYPHGMTEDKIIKKSIDEYHFSFENEWSKHICQFAEECYSEGLKLIYKGSCY